MKMKKLALIVVTGVSMSALAGGALADDKWRSNSGSNWLEHTASTKTRAEVMEELKQAQARGEVRIGQDPFYPEVRAQQNRSAVSGAEVRTEAQRTSRASNMSINSHHHLGS